MAEEGVPVLSVDLVMGMRGRRSRQSLEGEIRRKLIGGKSEGLCLFPSPFFIVTESETWRAWLDRLSTALFVTSLVSFLGLLTTYFDIRRNRTIVWDVADPTD